MARDMRVAVADTMKVDRIALRNGKVVSAKRRRKLSTPHAEGRKRNGTERTSRSGLNPATSIHARGKRARSVMKAASVLEKAA
jgi:hypothetical protein